MPDPCDDDLEEDPEYTIAFCHLVACDAERIDLDWTKFDYIKGVGVMKVVRRDVPPFPMPRVTQPPPEVGFLYASSIVDFAIPHMAELPPVKPTVQIGRDRFVEILESLAEDNLDLVVFYM
jgi:hypothetical protein